MAVHQAAARRTGHRVAAADGRRGHVCRNGKVVYGDADIWRLTRAASEKVLYINLSPSPKERSQNPPFKQSKENLEYLGNSVIITSATTQKWNFQEPFPIFVPNATWPIRINLF